VETSSASYHSRPHVIMLALFLSSLSASRTDYLLSYSWKFALEDQPTPKNCSASTFPVDLTDKQCDGLKQQLQVADEESCREMCCADDACSVWQWCEPGHDCAPANSCWTGDGIDMSACTNAQSGWASTGRTTTPGPSPQPQPGDACPNNSWCSVTYDDTKWRGVTLPHDFVVEGTFSESADKSHGYLPLTIGRYRKAFELPAGAESMHVRLDFEGSMSQTSVWLNGVCLGGHLSGYTPFGFVLSAANVTGFVNWGGTNVLAVHVDSVSTDAWWYDGGGLYRNVWLTTAPTLHHEQWGVYAPTTVTEGGTAGPAAATLHPSVEVVNDGATAARFSLTSIVSLGGVEVARAVSQGSAAANGGKATLNQTIDLGKPSLWAIDHPTLYTLTTVISPTTALVERSSGVSADVLNTTFGVRTIRFDANKGFFLNGVPTKIKGCANHQDVAGLGVAVPDALQAYRITALQAFGANGWRTAHNQPSRALLDAADRLGFLVWDENHHNGQPHEMELLIRRDRNHPSIVIWSLCNEVLCETADKNGDGKIAEAVIHKWDPLGGRPISANNNGMNGADTILDLQGFDYATGSYDEWHERAPTIPAISSETSSAVGDRGEYVNDPASAHVTGYDTEAPSWGQTAEVAWAAILEKPWMSGGFTWTGWDYKGEPTPYGWPNINSHFGIMDVAGFWKDRTYWYSAYYKPEVAQAHVFPHWSWAAGAHDSTPAPHRAPCEGLCHAALKSAPSASAADASVDMWVYTNGAEAELLVNNASLGRKRVANHSHAQWKAVPYAPGRVEARVYRSVGDATPMATDAVETVGAPHALTISASPVNLAAAAALPANGVDVAFYHVAVVDAAGRVVPNANHTVTFSVQGPGGVVGTGNGDPSSHVPDHAPSRPAYHGLVLGIISADDTGKPTTLTVSASADGLASATATLEVMAGERLLRL